MSKPLDIGTVAQWATVVATLAVGVITWGLTRRYYRRENIMKMNDDYSELAGSREIFWTALREAYTHFRQSHQQVPESIEVLTRTCGSPPNLMPRKGRDLRLWPAENVDKLSPDQRIIGEFASLVYPARNGHQGWVTDHTCISKAHAKQFHVARNELAKFWEKWVPFIPTEYLCKNYVSAREQLLLLAWLEIALYQWTNDPGEGKTALFQMAQNVNNICSGQSGDNVGMLKQNLISRETIKRQLPTLLLVLAFLIFAFLWTFKEDWHSMLVPIGTALGALLGVIPGLMSEKMRGRWFSAFIGSILVGLVAWYTTSQLEVKRDQLQDERDKLVLRLNEKATEAKEIQSRYQRFKDELPYYFSVRDEKVIILKNLNYTMVNEFKKTNYSYVGDLTQVILNIEPDNGNGLYYAGEIDRIKKSSDLGRQRFYLYLINEKKFSLRKQGSVKDKALTDEMARKGYFHERTGWINHLLANAFYDKGRQNKDNNKLGDFKDALSYACEVFVHRPKGFNDDDQRTATVALKNKLIEELEKLGEQTKGCPAPQPTN